jgi:hypothetical protein
LKSIYLQWWVLKLIGAPGTLRKHLSSFEQPGSHGRGLLGLFIHCQAFFFPEMRAWPARLQKQ